MSKSTAVGAFVLGGLALGVIAILMFAGSSLFAPKMQVVSFFRDSVAGLTVGSPVTLRGVKIGTVQSVKVTVKLPEMVPVIRVYMNLQPEQVSWTGSAPQVDVSDIELAVKSGLRAQLTTQSLVTGQVAVSLDFHPDTPVTLFGGGGVPEIPTIPSDFEKIKNQIADLNLPDLVDKAKVTLAGLNEIIAQLNGKLGPLVDSVRQTSDDARTTLDATTAAVQQLQHDSSRSLDAVNHLASTAETQVVASGQALNQVATNAQSAVTDAQKLLQSLNTLTAQRSTLRGNLEATMRDLAASASSLRSFSSEVERNPSLLLLGRGSR